ncbi:hypothetical protein V6N11_044246 [Hibiscus sabdariffa]|uniref:Uncharacterized protein n=1 Tax=Hibiscus sabdariffa TaxID=183260 RepID=A0ABR2REM2_9ROSI
MDVSKAVVMDLNNAIETVLLASSPIVVPPAPLSTLFYKDTLLASGFAGSQPVVDTIDDEEVILLEGNVARSNVDGVISIQFSEHVQVLAIKNLEMTIFIKIIGRRIGYHTLRTKLYDLWNSRKAASHTNLSVSSSRSAVVHDPWFNPIFEENLYIAPASADANSHAATAIIAIGAVAPSDPMVAPISISSPMVVCDAVFAPPSSNSPTPQSWRSSAVSTSKTTTLTSRPSSTLSFARFALFPRLSSKFNKANHTAIVFEENADPNVHTPAPNNLPLPPNATMVAPLDPPLSREMVSASCDNGGNLLNGCFPVVPQYDLDSLAAALSFSERDAICAALGFSLTLTLVVCEKISLVNWSTIAQPCNRGGLGIPSCYERNLAFMQKLAFQLNYSPLWCALPNIWDSFRDNIFWLVGDGNDLHFADMLQADGNWNVSRLSELLDQAVVPHVLGVLPPSFDDARDTMAWRHTPTGAFTVASTYENILCKSWDACDPKWSCIWSLPVARRVAPAHDWVCLNTDVVVSLPDHLGSLGGVLRGPTGDWLRGYLQYVGVVSPLNAELWTLLVLSAASLLCRSPLVAALSLGSSGDEYDG